MYRRLSLSAFYTDRQLPYIVPTALDRNVKNAVQSDENQTVRTTIHRSNVDAIEPIYACRESSLRHYG